MTSLIQNPVRFAADMIAWVVSRAGVLVSCLVLGASPVVSALPVDEPHPPIGTPYVLPQALVPAFESGKFATRFYVRAGPVAQAAITVWFSTEGGGGEVQLKTIYRGPTSPGHVRLDDVSTSFQPTAVCVRSGETDTLYVAGWFPRQRMAVVEEWVLAPLAIGETLGPNGKAVPGISEIRFTKRLLVITTGVEAKPIEAIACDALSDELIVLEYGPAATLSRIDLSLPAEEMALEVVADGSTVPQLVATKHMKVGMHETRGLTITLKDARAWNLPTKDPVIALHDVSNNGAIDYLAPSTIPLAELEEEFPSDGWVKYW